MPELPEVRTVVKQLSAHVIGAKIRNVVVKKPKLIKEILPSEFQTKLQNRIIIQITNLGKFILFLLDDEQVLISHLRMEGKYHIEAWEKDQHDHLIFQLDNNQNLYYNDSRQFGTFHLRTKASYLKTDPLQKVAKEPQQIDITSFWTICQKRKIAIKTLLLDQTLVSGLGNIYVNEVLFATKVHPQTLCNELSQAKLKEILETSTQILDLATEYGGSTIKSYQSFDSHIGQFQQFLKVHNRAGQKCLNCKAIINKIKVNGRGTYFCPLEQKKLS